MSKLRGNNRYIMDYGIADIYKYYKSKSDKPISASLFSKIIREHNEIISEEIIFGNFEYKMPGRLGDIRIKKNKIQVKIDNDGKVDKSRLRPDWKATNDLWDRDEESRDNKKLIYHLNPHNNGYNCRWFWSKVTCNVPNQKAYALLPTRYNKRKLAEALLDEDCKVNYYE